MIKSRRNFLKVSAATSAVLVGSGTLSGAFAKEFAKRTIKIPSASHFGAFYAHVMDGEIVDITSQLDSDANPTVLVKALADRNSSDSRVKYPVVRKSYLEGKVKGNLRGKEEFVRVSWEKALDLVADSIRKAQEKGGNESLYNASYGGWSHPGAFKPNVLAGRFFNQIGGAVGTFGEYSNGAAGAVNPSIVGDMEVYSIQTAHEQIIENTKILVLWGADLYKTNRAGYSVPNHRCYDAYEEYKKAGIKVISIDPIYTTSAKEFKADWIKIRPGSDVALMLAMMNYLYKSKKYDKEFIEKYTYGFDKFLPYLLGESDGIEKNTKWAEKLTEIPSETIEKLADIMISNRTFIAGNWAMQRAEYGEQVDWALITLASMIGQVGLAGGGFGFSMHYEGGGDAASGQRTVGGISQGSGDEVNISIPASRMSDLINNPGEKVTYKGSEIIYPKVHFMLSAGASPIGHQPNTNELIDALRKLDTFVVIEPWWTPTAKMADIVLPATTTMERDDIASAMSYSNDRIYAMKKIVDARYEAKDDYEIFTELAKRFGKEKAYTRDRTPKDWLERIYNISSAKRNMKISFEEFWEKGVIAYDIPESAKKYVRHEAFRKDPIANALKTETGKIQIYSEKLASYGYDDFKGHPMWFEPTEWLGNEELTKKYPLHLLSPHPTNRIHTQLDNTWVQNAIKVQGREPIRISPNDANKFGIKDGEVVEVYNERGSVLAGVVVTNTIRDGVVAIEEGAWYSPEDANAGDSLFSGNDQRKVRCNSGQVNVLTTSKGTSKMANATSVNSTLVSIRKVKILTPNLAYNPPKIVGA
ncbi:Dimethyl sulfoxide/trimethylamine N-oxide reductase precursor [Aliarcobacter thereius]|uniref:trimethylamine-N-oxide reductase n=2 Tax=Aliarcobacter thereius TaxID=544718 RepID=A0A1C0B746_9BACT|nr:molybdopterin-dependent oxidoreductase [Aliarcobacter thereius]OCL86873.1 Dimethyl sulfoxide/trimethylamine N-oxide reductase precursor [Aliarcobacter thereius]OCL91055.1 Dimethyl sulfoxide/trimethylamine N-oxide reductase precursor [Aliarcobacter thereius]OCL96091.1 Dimethyl sulfoxide/trimethylamine N-oxide reductase precursor [Aliarcobacter thereius LMG 24486]OCL99425.1 Dimethyl sulfoxide/trimethylamine N-oxide reductase precursor [Aliarcobacter thereius]QBF15937.1 molybdopterin-containin